MKKCLYFVEHGCHVYVFSSDIDGWFWDIYEALKYRPHQMLNPEVINILLHCLKGWDQLCKHTQTVCQRY